MVSSTRKQIIEIGARLVKMSQLYALVLMQTETWNTIG